MFSSQLLRWLFGDSGEEEDSPFAHLKPAAGSRAHFAIPEENAEVCSQIRDLLQSKQCNSSGQRAPFLVSDCGILLSGFYSTDLIPSLLAEHNVTHVINMAHGDTLEPERAALHEKAGIRYLGIAARDEEGYDIMQQQHWNEVSAFARAWDGNGRLLVHCMAGVNRSAALAVALVCWKEKTTLLAAIAQVQERGGGTILTNLQFQSRLVTWASEHGVKI